MTKSIVKMLTDKWKIIILEYEKVKNGQSRLFKTVNDLCEAHNVSRKQLHKYRERWLMSGKKIESLLPEKRGPRRGSHRMLNKEQERIIVKIQRQFEAKPLDVWCMIKGTWNMHPSVKTIARTLKRYPQAKKKEIIHRYEKKIPGELVHADTFNLPKLLFKDGKQRYLKGVIDDCTRLNYVELIEAKKMFDTCHAMLRAGKWFDIHGIQIEKLMSDNGSEYTSVHGQKKPQGRAQHVFEMMLAFEGIEHIYIKPYKPQTNGKIERFWRIFRTEFLPGLKNLDKKEFNEKLKQFMYYYNYLRPHGGLKYQTPFEKLISVTETLSIYTRGKVVDCVVGDFF